MQADTHTRTRPHAFTRIPQVFKYIFNNNLSLSHRNSQAFVMRLLKPNKAAFQGKKTACARLCTGLNPNARAHASGAARGGL